MSDQLIIPENFLFQGHRGARGLTPENTIPSFKTALDNGANALEMDIVVGKNGQLIVSHEPWMHHNTCSDKTGEAIKEEQSQEFKILEMTVAEVQSFDCGKRGHPKFPRQEKIEVVKPTFEDLVITSDAYAKELGMELPFYSVEVKSYKDWYNSFIPEPDEFAKFVKDGIEKVGIKERCTVMCFDVKFLQAFRKIAPDISVTFLVDNMKSLETNLELLGFIPESYGPYFKLILLNKNLPQKLHKKGITLVPWTVNELSDMRKLIKLGVDGLTTDYPDLFQELKAGI